MIALCFALGSLPGTPLQPETQALMRVGTHVLGNWMAEGNWYHAVVTADHGNGSFAVSYDDPDRGGSAVPLARLRLAFRPGTHVLGNYADEGTWYHALVTADHGDNTYKLAYDDPDRGGSAVPAARIKNAFNPGTEVEGNYQAEGTWYHAVIVSDHGNNTSALQYDDPDRGGIAVPAERIRLPQTGQQTGGGGSATGGASPTTTGTGAQTGAPSASTNTTAATNHRAAGGAMKTNGTKQQHHGGRNQGEPTQGVWRKYE